MARAVRPIPLYGRRYHEPGRVWVCPPFPRPESTRGTVSVDRRLIPVLRIASVSFSAPDPRLRYDYETPLPVWLKGLRARLGVTQAELARNLRVTRTSVMRWECGFRTPSRRHRLILNAIAMSVGYRPVAAPRRNANSMVFSVPERWKERQRDESAIESDNL